MCLALTVGVHQGSGRITPLDWGIGWEGDVDEHSGSDRYEQQQGVRVKSIPLGSRCRFLL